MSRIPRIVIVGEMIDGSTAPALAQGFREAGWIVERIDTARYVSQRNGFADRVARRLSMPTAVAAFNRGILASIAAQRTDVLLVVKGSFVRPATLQRARARGVIAVQFYPDVEWDHAGIAADFPDQFDIVFTTKSFQLPTLRARLGDSRVRFIHHGFDPLIHRPIVVPEEAAFARDVVFIANFSPYKLTMLEGIAAIEGIDFTIFGGGWGAAAGSSVERFVAHRVPTGDDYVLELCRSRIAIGLHHGPVRTPGWVDLVSTRSFEIPASGTMMLHIDNPEIRTLFEEGKEFAGFTDAGGLAERARQIIAYPAQRRAIAAAGHARALHEHSYWHRAKAIADELAPALDLD